MPTKNSFFYYLCLAVTIVIAKATFIAFFIAFGNFGLGPDEAQYWTWSKDLALGYYSKPPGIAWQIALSTFLFGDTEFGVRASSLILGSFIPIATFTLAKSCLLKPKTCFLASMAFAFSPLGILANVLAITDVGMVLFWTLAAQQACKALSEKALLPYYRIGFFILLGALFKWPTFLFWIFLIPLFIVRPKLYNKHFFLGIFLSLLALIPTIFWNMHNDWSTFKHVFSTIHNPSSSSADPAFFKGNFWEFIGMQALLIFPAAFILLCLILKAWYRDKNDIELSLVFCGASAFTIIVIYAFVAFFKKIQGNWCDFVYPQLFVIIAWGCCEKRPHLKKAFTASITAAAMMIIALPFFSHNFKHNVGWQNLTKELKNLGYNSSEHFLLSDKYQTSSILSFYGPEKKRAYFLNIHGIRNNQFSFWPGIESEAPEKTGFFVYIENAPNNFNNAKISSEYQKLLQDYFLNIEFLGQFSLQKNKSALIFKCSRYNGKASNKSELW